MSLPEGRKLGPYEIVVPLGKGGMGEVYRARDVRLDRSVAIKVLPPNLAGDPNFRTRFDQEARAASALSHANIAHVYDVGEDGGHHFIAMEYVEGEDLGSLVKQGPMDSDRIVEYAIQMVSALEAAHAKGIIHRDIKSANVMVSSDGQVKVLDFGLARREPARGQSAGDMLSTAFETQPGLILGTVPYMSPEQALGKAVDARSDIFSAGIVLYELATGRLPFKGESATDTIDKICHATPEQIESLNRKIPPELERIVRKCLEKDRDNRYATASDLLVDLRNLRRGTNTIPAAPRAATTKKRFTWYVAGAGIVATLAVLIALLFWRASVRGPIDSLAVIPFANESGNEAVEYLSDGISESLINALSKIPDLKVISRSSAFAFKGSTESLREIGRKLGVRAVLVGRMTQRGDDLTIGAELVDVEDDRQLWGDRYNRQLNDVLGVERELTATIVSKLRLELTGEQTERLARRGTDDPMAYQQFLKGVHFMEGTAEQMLKGQEALEEAIRLDPDYAEAHAALANAHMLALLHGTENREQALQATRQSLDRALAANPDIAEAQLVAGNIKLLYDWDLPGAEAAFARAVELSPGLSTAHQEYAWCMWAKGDPIRALASSQRALELDPLSRGPMHHIGYTQMAGRQFEEAVASFKRTIEVYPEWIWGHVKLGVALVYNGMPEEALLHAAEAESLIATGGETPLLRGWLGVIYARAGDEGKARAALARLLELMDSNAEIATDVAALYLALGDRDSAMERLEAAYEARAPWLIFVPEYFFFDELRGDPRFEKLMEKLDAATP